MLNYFGTMEKPHERPLILPPSGGYEKLVSYQVAPPVPLAPTVSNVAACALDLSWVPPGDLWDQLTVTGYSHWAILGLFLWTFL